MSIYQIQWVNAEGDASPDQNPSVGRVRRKGAVS
jgi:hypothetical protein